MQGKFFKDISGSCTNCGNDLVAGGYIKYNTKDEIEEVLCSACKEIETLTKVKKSELIVKRLVGWFFKGYYEVVSTKNIHITTLSLSEKELSDFVINPNIDVKIVYN
ncbi:hypothetical protein LCGC14_0667210 [marine sediment metagenome]|uniref:Uncharacterized protein n=1 Tax=marine sediment metagenome TaxID=412755 RepID=A0A0F9QX38_9ZZZZ